MNEESHGGPESRLADAEQLLDSLLGRVRGFTKKTAALAREEVEDIVAEAKQVKQREQV